MFRFIRLAVVVGFVGAAGCKGPQMGADVFGQPKPGLLVGPEATSQAPPAVELPAKESAQVCLITAQNYEKQGRVQEAIQLYEKARASDPATAAQACRRLAALYDKAGEFSKSSKLYSALMLSNPHDADLLNDLGYSYYSRGDWTNAAATLTKAVEADPSHKKAWTNLGLAQAQLGQWDESFQSFCNAVRPADAHCNIAFVLGAQGKPEEAKARYREALALDPSLRIAQAGLSQLENPAPAENKVAKKPSPMNAAEAAAQVPSIAEIEARLKMEAGNSPISIPGPDAKAANPR